MQRSIENAILDWIENGRESLLVTGARQIGKTFVIRECLKRSAVPYVEFNFLEQPELVTVFDQGDTQETLLKISGVAQKKLIPGKTVIFLDEVQEIKEIVTRIKFLVEEGSYRYILSGSLLGIELRNIRSVPVGYMTVLDMYPLTLREFYTALGLSAEIFSHIKQAYQTHVPVDEFIHERLMRTFFLYLLIGGMPEAVSVYLETNNLQEVARVHRKIIRLYEADFTKYEEAYNLRLKEIYDAVPGELKEKNKRFFINHLGTKTTFDRYANDFLWLKDAGVALPVYNVVEPVAPLIMNEKRSLFKLFYSDVGLLTSRYPAEVKRRILANDPYVNNGALFENAAAQELHAHEYKTYYFNNKKQGELDFLVEHEGQVLPIEIKSGKNYKKHSALDNVCANESYRIKEAYVFCNENVETAGKRVYLPIYMLMFLEEEQIGDVIVKMDLTDLNLNEH